MQIVRSHRKLRNVPCDAHERARAVIAILLHGVGHHARAVPVCECEQRVDDGRGAAGLEEDVRLFCVGHGLCGHGEEHVRVLVGEPVFERERPGRGADDTERWVRYGEVCGCLLNSRVSTARGSQT